MTLTTLQHVVLGIIQGITEWLPVSSSGLLVPAMSGLFGVTNVEEILKNALVLHLGTFLAAAIYFRKDVFRLSKSALRYGQAEKEEKNLLKFLAVSTVVSGIIGLIILRLLISLEEWFILTGKTITLAVGILLFVTGFVQMKKKNVGTRKVREIKNGDGIVTGIAQGFSSLPGISRSGITVSALMLRKFSETTALKLSFLMSLPIVLLGNLILNFNELTFSGGAVYGIAASFIFGLGTIHVMMKITRKINFGWFALIIAVMMVASVFV